MGCNHKSIAEYYKKYAFKKVLKMQCLVFLLMTNLLHVEAALRKMLTSGATKWQITSTPWSSPGSTCTNKSIARLMLTYNLGSQKSIHVVYCILSCSICSNAQIGYDYSLSGHTHKQFHLRTVWRHCELEKSSQYHRMRLTIFLLEEVTPRLGAYRFRSWERR